MFFNGEKRNETFENTNSNVTFNETPANNTNEVTHNNDLQHHAHHSHHKHRDMEKSHQRGKKSDRCLEANYEVCKSWSKKRLLHAQKCCSGAQTDAETLEQRSCDNFGKKRCKKIQSILKCCIKTVYTEPTAVAPTEEPTVTTDVPHICCKTTDKGKFCRVSTTGICEEDEEHSPNETM